MKMLTTQLTGLLQRIAGSQEEAVEDTARLLAQAAAGEGRVLLSGTGEMHGVVLNAIAGAEPFLKAAVLESPETPDQADRVWLFARSAADEEILQIARPLAERGIAFAAVGDVKESEDNELSSLADAYIATGVTRGLLPDDDGGRVVQPHLFAALFIFSAVKLSYDEMLMDL
ncbi:DUF2529 family protein [Sporosarcina trichiuri]|uniref:DUF2529 family protein n=1 Tax=Sporosarcina trichiuri TaxID=3056445 RepID=UPI0025B569DE|nr:DUF2529 family protein [Sporosarcina sp. 0.2-SM1T-5]WJY26530.1 DUF2529 family protein [Sporosarcina sp. 0.2-SM1T-5]